MSATDPSLDGCDDLKDGVSMENCLTHEEASERVKDSFQCGLDTLVRSFRHTLPGDRSLGVDITQSFFDTCSGLKLGEVVRADNFQLAEAMSAVELMDPKMDIGIVRMKPRMGLAVAVEAGIYACSLQEQLTTIDATLACFVTWLEGSNIAQNLLTNVLIAEANSVAATHTVFSSIAHAFIHIIHFVRCTVHNAGVYEEEDFNPHLPYACSSSYTFPDLIELLKKNEAEVLKCMQESKSEKPLLQAIYARLSFLRTFIDSQVMLVPPFREEDSDLDFNEVAGLNAAGFRPRLKQAAETTDRLVALAKKIEETQHLGMSFGESEESDGNYSDLPAFEPELNRRYLPSTFPRKTEVLPRKRALKALVGVTKRLNFIAREVQSHLSDSIGLANFMKKFNYDDSCVYTRSVLQLVLFPLDDNILNEIPCTELVDASIRNLVNPIFLIKDSPAYDDDTVNGLYGDFLVDFTKVSLNMFQLYGNNLARQRDKLAIAIEDMGCIQGMAEKIDAHCITLQPNPSKRDEVNVMDHPMATFAFQQLVMLIDYHMELSFRLELFANYEFPYIYWYYGDIVSRWLVNTTDRMQEMIFMGFQMESRTIQSTNKKGKSLKPAKKAKMDEKFKSRMVSNHSMRLMSFGKNTLSDGVVVAAIAMIDSGAITVPMWDSMSEHLRYDHRMSPFSALGQPMHLQYSQYLELSNVTQLRKKTSGELWSTAGDVFEEARGQFEKVAAQYDHLVDDANKLAKISKNNAIVARLLGSGKVIGKRPTLSFGSDSPIFPILRLE